MLGSDNPVLQILRDNPDILALLWALAVMYSVWRWENCDRKVNVSVPTRYEPPEGISPAEAAVLVDNQVESRDITATIVDLSRKGYIKIDPREEKDQGRVRRDYTLGLLKFRSTWENLAEHELEVLDALFPLVPTIYSATTSVTTLSGCSFRLSQAVPRIRKEIYRSLVEKRFISPQSEWSPMLIAACVGVIFLPFVWMVLKGLLIFDPSSKGFFLMGTTTVFTLGIVFHYGYRLVRKTPKGSRARAECLSFKDFISRVDADRLKELSEDAPERYLPYAIAFGVEVHWAEACQGLNMAELDLGWVKKCNTESLLAWLLDLPTTSDPDCKYGTIPISHFAELAHSSITGQNDGGI